MSRRDIDIVRKRGHFEKAKKKLVRRKPPRGFWAWPGIFVVGLAAAAGFMLLPEARVTVTARSEPVTRDLEIGVSAAESEPDSARLAVPGTAVAEETAGSKIVPATGTRNVGTKASGFVYIYNFSKTTLILKAATTVMSAGDRKYHFTQDVGNIRPTAFIGLEQQEVDPSSLIAPVPVIADAPGEQYNLAKDARLEIQNEVFGNKPKTLYAVVTEDGLRGGATKEAKVITEADIQNGYQSLIADLTAAAREKLSAGGAQLLDNGFTVETLEQSAKAAAGREAADFEVAAKIRIKGLVFRSDDVREVVEGRLTRLLPENQVLAGASGTRLTSQFAGFDSAAGTGTIIVHFEGAIVYRLDPAEIAKKIRGKNEYEIRELLLSRPEIREVAVEFHPFWVKKAPKYGQKITVDIK